MQPADYTRDAVHIGRGLLMGGADIIPGVSGGTIALILGIYERLVTAISHFDAQLVRLIRQRQWAAAAAHVDLRLLVPLGLGIALGIVSLAGLMHYLLTNYRSYTLAAFFGLILASSVVVARSARLTDRNKRWRAAVFFVAGAVVAWWLVSQHALQPWPGYWYTLACGMVAICAMILPGISGAYILLLLGKYEEITGIVKKLPKLECSTGEMLTLAVFAVGCALGLFLFSKLLRWLLAHWHTTTMATLCGFMIGSLYKIWPFQTDTTPEVESFSLKIFEPYMPQAIDGPVVACMVIATLCVAVVLIGDWLARHKRLPAPAT